MKIFIFLLTCFTSSATIYAPKIDIPISSTIFQKIENFGKSEKAKIGLEIPKAFGIARSSIEEQQTQTTTFHQNTFLLSSYLKEENSCVLDFQKAANSKSVVEGIQTGIDIISLVIPGAQTCTALKMLNYLDKASSIASLSGSYLQDDYPDLANVLNITSSILAITDLSANGVDILLKANTNPSAAIDIISESEDVLDATAHIEHVEVLLDRITAPSPDPQVMAVLNSSNPKTKDFLVDILEAEKHSAKGADRMDIVNKIDEAIEVVNSAGITAKYPINNFLDFVNSNFTASQKQLFNKAQDFYSSFNPSFNVNELRGIDFDLPITNVIKQEDNVMYQMVTIDPITGNPRFGSYFFENIDEDVTKLGIGDINRIKADGRVKVKIILDGEVDFLKSKTANIEDWTGSGNIFEGGGNQFYNPTAKTKIKSFEIIQTY